MVLPTAAAVHEAPAAHVPRANLLIVDDHRANLLALEGVLEDLGQRIVWANSGEEALGQLEREDFAVVLLDVQMRGMDGFQTATRIKQIDRARLTPIIFLSAAAQDEINLVRAYAQGAVDYVVKPFNPDILRAKVSVFVELFQKTEQLKHQEMALQVSTLLSSSLDYETTLQNMGKMVVPSLADWCAIDIIGDDGKLQRLAVHHRDPTKISMARELEQRYPPDPSSPYGVHEVLRTGTSQWMREIPEAVIRQASQDAEHLRLNLALGLRSYVVVPIKARGRVHGALTLVMAESTRLYAREDVARIEELASRAALAVDNARLYREVRHAEERYSSLIDATSQVIWTLSSSGEMLGEQVGWTELTGQASPLRDGREWLSRVHPEDQERTVFQIHTALEAKSVFEFEHRVQRRDGQWRYFAVRGVPLRAADGQVREWVGVHSDITDRRLADIHLALSAQVGSIIAQSDDLREMLKRCAQAVQDRLDAAFTRIWSLNAQTQILELEASAGQYTHLDGPHARVPVGKFKIGRIAQSRTPHLTNDVAHDEQIGDPAWAAREGMVAFAGYPLAVDGRVVGVLALFSRRPLPPATLDGLASVADMVATGVQRRRVELEMAQSLHRLEALTADLKVSEEKFRSMAEALPQQVWTATPAGNLDFVNERVTQFFGRTEAQILGEGWLSGLHPDDIEPCLQRWSQSLATGAPYEVEFRLKRADDGLYRWHLAQALPMRNQAGAIAKWCGSNTDIDDRKRTEQERERLIGALERSNKELDQFAYVASHDLKAPLRGISNLSQWIEEDLQEKMTDDTREQMRLLRGRVHRMEGLINGILSYSRAGRAATPVETVETAALVKETVELLAPKEGTRVELAGGLPVLVTEKVPFQQTLMNLLGNAFKYARRPDVIVGVSATERGNFWEFAVSDNGPGIAPEYHERIWGIFQTLAARDDVEGTGIGLSVVKKIVESKGGRAWVESTEGQGATFRFTWPKREPARN